MKLRFASLLVYSALASLAFTAVQAQTQLYFNGFENYGLGPLGTQGLGQGWYSSGVTNTGGHSTHIDVVSGNAPFAPGGNKSLNISRTAGVSGSQPRPQLYFADTTVHGSNVTGALGYNPSGQALKNMTFSWDFHTTTQWTQPQFGFYDAGGFDLSNVAVLFEIRSDAGYALRYADGEGTFSVYSNYIFKNNTWYNFVVSNIDTVQHTYDVQVFQHGISDAVVVISGAKFYANVDEIATWRVGANSTGAHSMTIDNYTISQIPEASSYAALIGLVSIAALWLRR